MKNTFLLSLYLFVAFSFNACTSQEIEFADPYNTIAHQIAVQKYADFLEQTDFYAFHDHDLNPSLTDAFHTKNQTRATQLKPSLYSRFNQLQPEIQDHITGFLQATKRSETLNLTTNSYPMIIDQEERAALTRKMYNSITYYQVKNFDSVKENLRIEYWNRFVKRARGQHPMINNRMQSSDELCRSFDRSFLMHSIFMSIEDKYDIEIAALMIACGALVNLDKTEPSTPLYYAIRNDDIPMIRLLMKAGLIRVDGSKAVIINQENLIILAAEKNALQSVKYLHSIGYNINAQESSSGDTALHQAFFNNNYDAIKLLLELGANPKIKNYAHQEFNSHKNTKEYYEYLGRFGSHQSSY